MEREVEDPGKWEQWDMQWSKVLEDIEQDSRIEHQTGATGKALRRDTDTEGWEGERSTRTAKFLL